MDRPKTREEELVLLQRTENLFIIIENNTVVGTVALHDPDVDNGVVELGVYFGERIARKSGATEAIYLISKFVFDDLGYRRLEWLCDNRNDASKYAAVRYGFVYEALHRKHIVAKHVRDACVYSLVEKDWPAVKFAFENWLDPKNFDENGMQIKKLRDMRTPTPISSIDPPPPVISAEKSEYNALTIDMSKWTPREPPARMTIEGKFVVLEALDTEKHGDALYDIVSKEPQRFEYLPDEPPKNRDDFQTWLEKAQKSDDPLYFVVIDKRTGKVGGRQTFLRIEKTHGVIEIGHILWTSLVSQKPAATEALYLFAKYIFDDLGYRRFEWKCDNLNSASKNAALRFGFKYEGVFRQHRVIKGRNRDTAWFAMLKDNWPVCKKAFEKWLDETNFDDNGKQKKRLVDIRKEIQEMKLLLSFPGIGRGLANYRN